MRPAVLLFSRLLGPGLLALACGGGAQEGEVPVPGREAAVKSAAAVRAERRAYDGAPPVIAHDDFGIGCVSCHNETGMAVEGVGYAPPSPHENTLGLSAVSLCQQCHVFARTESVRVANHFVPLRQDLGRGRRLNPLAPATIPHKTFMRENCAACHTGPAAREEIRTSHPERSHCRQCHVPETAAGTFPPRAAAEAAAGS